MPDCDLLAGLGTEATDRIEVMVPVDTDHPATAVTMTAEGCMVSLAFDIVFVAILAWF
jgi:hypothetical protein